MSSPFQRHLYKWTILNVSIFWITRKTETGQKNVSGACLLKIRCTLNYVLNSLRKSHFLLHSINMISFFRWLLLQKTYIIFNSKMINMLANSVIVSWTIIESASPYFRRRYRFHLLFIIEFKEIIEFTHFKNEHAISGMHKSLSFQWRNIYTKECISTHNWNYFEWARKWLHFDLYHLSIPCSQINFIGKHTIWRQWHHST